jgi:hypothetical protein
MGIYPKTISIPAENMTDLSLPLSLDAIRPRERTQTWNDVFQLHFLLE